MKITHKKLYLYFKNYSFNCKFFNKNYLNVDNLYVVNNLMLQPFFKKLWLYFMNEFFLSIQK